MLFHDRNSGVTGNNRGKFMKRIESALLAGVPLAALAPFAAAAQAQSTLPPPNVVTDNIWRWKRTLRLGSGGKRCERRKGNTGEKSRFDPFHEFPPVVSGHAGISIMKQH